MCGTTGDGVGDDATRAFLACAERAELGDLTSSVHVLSSMSVAVGSEAGLRVVRVGGELTTGSAAYLDVVLEQEIGSSPRALIVDLSDAGFVGVRGIAALLRAAAAAARNRTTLCVVPPFHPDFVRHVRVLGLAGLFDLYGSVADCRSALAGRDAGCDPEVLSFREEGEADVAPGPSPGPDDRHLEIVAEPGGSGVVVRLSGPLSLRTVSSVRAALTKLLVESGRVVADLSAVRLQWTPALQVFPSTLTAAGGWPTARLVLLDADRELTAALMALRIDRVVPLARGLPDARAAIDRRPAIVIRYHDLVHGSSSPRRARALLRLACVDWQIEEFAGDAAVVTTELVTNAVQHARTPCRSTLRLDDGALSITVRDHEVADQATLERLRSAKSGTGGLRTVAAIARNQGVTPHDDGKSVWASIDRHRRP